MFSIEIQRTPSTVIYLPACKFVFHHVPKISHCFQMSNATAKGGSMSLCQALYQSKNYITLYKLQNFRTSPYSKN